MKRFKRTKWLPLTHFWTASGMVFLLLWAAEARSWGSARESRQNREQSDALFENQGVLRLMIEIPKEGLESLRKDQHRYVRATLREGNTVYSNVAVHLKGSAGSFRQVDDKVGLTLNFDLFQPKAPRFHGLKKLHLNNSVQDPSYLSELACGGMFRAAGVPASRVTHTLVDLNGRRLGLYVLIESMNKDFLAPYFKATEGNLYGQPGGGDVTDNIERMAGDRPLTREDLKALAAAAQEKDPATRLKRLEQRLDVDRFLSYMALEVLLDHWDGYTFSRHNYRVYHDLDTDRMVFFPHDMDQMMRDINRPVVPDVNGMMAQVVLNTPELRARYLDRAGTLFTNVFQVAKLTNQVNQALEKILPAIRTYDANLAREVENNARGLNDRFVNRARFIQKQFAITAVPPPKKPK